MIWFANLCAALSALYLPVAHYTEGCGSWMFLFLLISWPVEIRLVLSPPATPSTPVCRGQQHGGCAVPPHPLAGGVLYIFAGAASKSRVVRAPHFFLESVLPSGCPEKQHGRPLAPKVALAIPVWTCRSPPTGASPLPCLLKSPGMNPAHLPCALRQRRNIYHRLWQVIQQELG